MYDVIRSESEAHLCEAVTKAMGEGWELAGGIQVAPIDGVTWYIQAMFKRGTTNAATGTHAGNPG